MTLNTVLNAFKSSDPNAFKSALGKLNNYGEKDLLQTAFRTGKVAEQTIHGTVGNSPLNPYNSVEELEGSLKGRVAGYQEKPGFFARIFCCLFSCLFKSSKTEGTHLLLAKKQGDYHYRVEIEVDEEGDIVRLQKERVSIEQLDRQAKAEDKAKQKKARAAQKEFEKAQKAEQEERARKAAAQTEEAEAQKATKARAAAEAAKLKTDLDSEHVKAAEIKRQIKEREAEKAPIKTALAHCLSKETKREKLAESVLLIRDVIRAVKNSEAKKLSEAATPHLEKIETAIIMLKNAANKEDVNKAWAALDRAAKFSTLVIHSDVSNRNFGDRAVPADFLRWMETVSQIYIGAHQTIRKR